MDNQGTRFGSFNETEQRFFEFHEKMGLLHEKASWLFEQIKTEDTGFTLLEEVLNGMEDAILSTVIHSAEQKE